MGLDQDRSLPSQVSVGKPHILASLAGPVNPRGEHFRTPYDTNSLQRQPNNTSGARDDNSRDVKIPMVSPPGQFNEPTSPYDVNDSISVTMEDPTEVDPNTEELIPGNFRGNYWDRFLQRPIRNSIKLGLSLFLGSIGVGAATAAIQDPSLLARPLNAVTSSFHPGQPSKETPVHVTNLDQGSPYQDQEPSKNNPVTSSPPDKQIDEPPPHQGNGGKFITD